MKRRKEYNKTWRKGKEKNQMDRLRLWGFVVLLYLVVGSRSEPRFSSGLPMRLSDLHVYTTYTSDMHWLYVNLVDSLVAQSLPFQNMHARVLPATSAKYKHGSPEFLKFCIERTDWVLSVVRQNSQKIVLITDVDVQVFPGWWEALEPCITEKAAQGTDLIFQPEYGRKKGNAGFYFALGTNNAALFLQTVRDNLAQKLKIGEVMHDQDMFYKVQRDKRFKIATFSWHLVNAGMGKKFHAPTKVHHAHMSGAYKFYNMRNMLKSKREQYPILN